MPSKFLIFITLSLFSLISISTVQAQNENKALQKADQLFLEAKYSKAAKQYEKVVSDQDYNQYAYLQLSRSLIELEEYADAETYFSVIFVESDTVDPALFLEFGELLMKNDKPAEARSYFASYNNLVENNDPRALRYISSIEEINTYYLDSAFIHIQRLKNSSSAQDYNPEYFREKLFFLSNRETYESEPLNSSLYSIPPFEIDDKAKAEKLKGSAFDGKKQGGFSIASSTGEVFFVRFSEDANSSQGTLMRAFIENEGTQISKSEIISIEGFTQGILYPSVSSSGNTIIFSSDAGDGYGSELYTCQRTTYGYSQPVKLPGFINSMGDESHPCLVDDTLLFFSSDGHGGLGGLDIYYINLNEINALPSNLGYPINSRYDDFDFSLANDADIGFLASDRATEKSLSDLYSFSLNQIRAMGIVTDQASGENLKNVAIEISKKGESSNEMTLADNGKFSIVAYPGDEYNLTVFKEGYSMESYSVAVDNARPAGLYEVDLGQFPMNKLDGPVPETEPEPIYVAPVISVSSLVFRLQIAAARRELSDYEIDRKYKGTIPVSMFREDGWYKYIIGEYNSYFEANEVRKTCGVTDAFIVAYDDDIKLVLSEAIRKAHSLSEGNQFKGARSAENTLEQYTIFFPFNKHFPDVIESDKIEAVKKDLLADMQLKAEIIGHADSRGSRDYNLSLAEARANYIRDSLIKSGIAGERIIIKSMGESQMRKKCSGDCPEQTNKENRRVEVFLFRN